jgi:FMNH2-dependent dimethyl sulfone monooxygenase
VKQNATGDGDYQQWLANTHLEQRVSLDDYSVSNRGLRSGLAGTTPVADHIGEFERADVHLVFLQVSPQMKEMESFSELVIKPHALRSAAS